MRLRNLLTSPSLCSLACELGWAIASVHWVSTNEHRMRWCASRACLACQYSELWLWGSVFPSVQCDTGLDQRFSNLRACIRISDLAGLGWGPRTCISNKFPSDVEPHFTSHCCWSRTTLWKPVIPDALSSTIGKTHSWALSSQMAGFVSDQAPQL